MTVPHAVRRVRWSVDVVDPDEADHMRARVRNELHDVALAELERAFSDMVSGDEIVHIPRLSLKVALEDSDAPASRLVVELREQLADLRCLSVAARLPRAGRSPPSGRSLPAREVIIDYVMEGKLAWHVASIELSELREWLRTTAASELTSIVGAITSGGRSAFEPALRRILRLLAILPHGMWVDVTRLARPATAPATWPPLSDVIGSLALAGGLSWARELAALVLTAALTPDAPATKMAAAIGQLVGDKEALPETARRWIEALTDLPPTAAAPQATFTAQRRETPAVSGRPEEPTPPPIEKSGFELAASSPTADAQFGELVHNAGLVLLHPYLPRYLEACGVRAVDGALPAKILPRAASLIHLLARKDAPLELEFGFVKMLLGLSPVAEMPLGPSSLTDEDYAEAASLLQTVISHWKVLKSTSVEGLRTIFLQRPGLVTEQELGWELRVESGAFDILLEQLPWSFRVVKLPWMDRPLYTEWAT